MRKREFLTFLKKVNLALPSHPVLFYRDLGRPGTVLVGSVIDIQRKFLGFCMREMPWRQNWILLRMVMQGRVRMALRVMPGIFQKSAPVLSRSGQFMGLSFLR